MKTSDNSNINVSISGSLPYADRMKAQEFVHDQNVQLTLSTFVRIAIQLLIALTPERFAELGLRQGVEKAAAVLMGNAKAEAPADAAGQTPKDAAATGKSHEPCTEAVL